MAPSATNTVAALDNLSRDDISEAERMEVTDALRRCLDRLQTPFEKAWDMTIAQPFLFAACQTGIDLGLWQGWRSAGGGQKTLDELVKMCKTDCEANLLRRLMRMLVARNVVKETAEDTFEPTEFSLSLGDNELKERSIALTMQSGTHHTFPGVLMFPKSLAEASYKEPKAENQAPYIKMPENEQGLAFFDRLASRPEYQESFVACMSNITAWKQNWTEYFDTSTIFDDSVEENAKERPIWVDVGGNTGRDVARFLEMHPDVPEGSVVLQDVEDVVKMARVNKKIRTVAHDFFTPQPVSCHGSRVYFLHSILHDWPDNLALDILRNLKPAFKKGYSKLIIVDVVVPAQGASVMQAAHDLCLMIYLAAGERTEKAWSELLEAAGFTFVKVWTDTRGIESVIEAELKDI